MPEKKNMERQQGKETPQKEEPRAGEAVIYIGPAIKGVVSPGMILCNGLTPQLAAAVKENPSMRLLLAEASQTAQARRELRDRSSARAICYARVEEAASGKGAHK